MQNVTTNVGLEPDQEIKTLTLMEENSKVRYKYFQFVFNAQKTSLISLIITLIPAVKKTVAME